MHTIGALWQDVRYATRSLRKTPGFYDCRAADAGARHRRQHRHLLGPQRRRLAPASLRDPERLVGVWNSWDGEPRGRLSPAEYLDYRERVRAFEYFGVSAGRFMTLTGEGEPHSPAGRLIFAWCAPRAGQSHRARRYVHRR